MEVLTLGEKIRLKRKEKNLTLKELAGDKVTSGQISLVESGKANPSIELLQYIAEKLDTDIEYFLESEEKQASRICEFYCNICESAIISEDFLKAIEAIEKGAFYADKYNLNYYKAKFEYFYAKIEYKRDNLQAAQLHCLYANSLFLKTDSIDDIIKTFLLLGQISFSMGAINTALNYFIQADSMLNRDEYVNEKLKANIMYNIAKCYDKLGDIKQAISFANIAKDKLSILEDKKKYGEILMLLSLSYAKENNLNKALKYAEMAREVFESFESDNEIVEIEMSLGNIFSKIGNFEESFEHLNKALKLKNKKDSNFYDILFSYSENYIKIKDYDKALEFVNKIFDEFGENSLYRIKCYKLFYEIYDEKNDYNNAEKILLEAIKYLEALDLKKELADFYTILGRFYMKVNERELALNYLDKGLQIYKELGIIL